MEEKSTEAQVHDHELNEALEKDAGQELDGLSIRNQRLARILEYEEAALSRSDPHAAVIGMGNAQLQRICEHVGDAVLERWDAHTPTVEEIRELSPQIRLMVAMRKMMDTDLAFQSEDFQQQAAAFPHSAKRKGITNHVGSSQRGLVAKRWAEND